MGAQKRPGRDGLRGQDVGVVLPGQQLLQVNDDRRPAMLRIRERGDI